MVITIYVCIVSRNFVILFVGFVHELLDLSKESFVSLTNTKLQIIIMTSNVVVMHCQSHETVSLVRQ